MRDLVEAALGEALDQLLRADAGLLQADANERSISHRLAGYLETFFPGWNVDCEYNRDRHEPKRLEIRPRQIQSDDTQATTVFPDIIVHRRGTSDNLVVIEMKKTTSREDDDNDLHKLQAFKEQLGYRFAIFVKVTTGGVSQVADVRWV